MQNVISYAKHVNCFIECLKKNLHPRVGRNFNLQRSKFLTFKGRKFYLQRSNFLTFKGQNFYLWRSKILTFEGQTFYLQRSKFRPISGRICTIAMGVFRPKYWSKFWPPVGWSDLPLEKFQPMSWTTLVEVWSKNESKFWPSMVEKWSQM